VFAGRSDEPNVLTLASRTGSEIEAMERAGELLREAARDWAAGFTPV
jgi:hypothetical protein